MAANMTHAQKKRKLFDELCAKVDTLVNSANQPQDLVSQANPLAADVTRAAIDYVNEARLMRATDEAKKAKRYALEELAMCTAWHYHVSERDMGIKEKEEQNNASHDVVVKARTYLNESVVAMPPAQLEEQAQKALDMLGLTPVNIVHMAQRANPYDPTQFTVRYSPVRQDGRFMLLHLAALCRFMQTRHGVKVDRLYIAANGGPRVGIAVHALSDKPKK
jgi:hypothetical protein